ncbi:hypothetical protein DNTS_020249 [Danionella cerebrum]|uniref:Uncharacterized protein n=1 Tax=Danionella cerebrum TaxID=2873325 RepID=A0A553NW87_9TELE|nr:hypothetical protein DNTS_020249 [Danionella translucida]
MFAVVYRKCRDSKTGTTNSRVTDEEECNRTYETINISIPPTTDSSAQKDAVIYKEVVTYSKLQAYKVRKHPSSP